MIGMGHLNNVNNEDEQSQSSTGGASSSSGGEATKGEMNESGIRDKASGQREGWIDFDRAAGGEDKIAEKKLAQIPMDCPSCGKTGGHMKSCQTNIPHFKDIVILAYNCDECGYRTNEIKAGGGVPEKGCRWTLVVSGTKPEDMHRDVLKSNSARITIQELGFEMEAGSLGGVYTTTEGLLGQIHDKLKDSNPFAYGDGATDAMKSNFMKFLSKINEMRTGLEPFTMVLEDPMDHSFIYSPASDGFEDDDLTKEYYVRTAEEEEDYGLTDMITENYDENGSL
jgi:zinc finger protein